MAVLLLSAVFIAAIPSRPASAAQIVNRSITLVQGTVDTNSDGINDGGSMPGGTVGHRFKFDLPTAGTVGSVKFEYCTTASVAACVTPTAMSTAGVTLGSFGTGNDIVFTAVTSTAANSMYVSKVPAAISAGDTVDVTLNSILNPSTTNYTFFVRISSYASNDTTGSAIDTGSVAASTATPIVLTGVMPESLIFCTGATVSMTSGIPDCTTATAGNISFDQLFSPTDTATAESQMAASTNAGQGYVITVNGPTLTSGANTIPAMFGGVAGPGATPVASTVGTGQFGLNLVLNTTTMDNQGTPQALGADVNLAPNGTSRKGQPSSDYGTDDVFEFTSGDTVAASDNGGTPGPTDAQIYTVGYVVNVSGSQPAGTYVTTLTYICTPTF
jgi:hypothetical protein